MIFYFDIDGTLYEPRIGVRESTRIALNKLKEAGHKVAIATGRSYLGAVDLADDLGIDYLVCDGGDSVYEKHKCIYHQGLPQSEYQKMAKLGDDLGIAYIYADDQHYYGKQKMESFELKHPWIDYLGDIPLEKVDIMKFAYAVNEEQSALLASKIEVNTLLFKDVMCLVSDPSNKAKGIKECSKLLGVDKTIVFGDSMNDVEMFKAADFAVCMGQAMEAVKKEADYVTKAVDEDGIYDACVVKGWINR